MRATFILAGRPFMPSMSLFVTCETEAELERLYTTLSEDGQVLMPLGDHGLSRRFGWVNDRFDVMATQSAV